MGGVGGGLYLGFMLISKEWVKVSENISSEAGKKKVKKKKGGNKNRDDSDREESDYDIVNKIAKEINELFKTNLKFFQNQRETYDEDNEDYNRAGLGICIGRGFTEVSVDTMEKHMKDVKTLEEIGKTYGLGKPSFYVVDLECYC